MKYRKELQDVDFGEVRKLNDERVVVDIIYFERRAQSVEKTS